MEEKKLGDLSDEMLDKVTGGGGYGKPGDETIEQELMHGQQQCGFCGKVITPEWNQAKKKHICPICKNDL